MPTLTFWRICELRRECELRRKRCLLEARILISVVKAARAEKVLFHHMPCTFLELMPNAGDSGVRGGSVQYRVILKRP